MNHKPSIALIATGGTIAGAATSASDTTGYAAGAIKVAALLEAVPGLEAIADIRPETLFALDSKDMTPAHWLTLAQRVQSLAEQRDIDGIVITHGTDTLEETAFFLHLTLGTDKPVVLTAAMRPATALSADGPMNLFAAVSVAGSAEFRGLGTLVAVNDRVFAAREVSKWHTRAVEGVGSPETGALGWANPPRLRRPSHEFDRGVLPLAAVDAARWPLAVEVFYLTAGASPMLLDAAVDAGLRGAVLACAGHGSLPDSWLPAVERAIANGCAVVRASRVAQGSVGAGHGPAGLLNAGTLSPSKARVALMLCLASSAAERFGEIAS
ncbi:L-asparaginase [Parazoarcus communis]|uniref:L-asparaginase n=1 Tax=Parazoarcus communis TaxID=41977 RepID=A0A2U8GQU2_9RHOO|nr:asparaginase [Parazoarcus communis]AWI75850.1 L-asparaginase [Parazoarcus communis]